MDDINKLKEIIEAATKDTKHYLNGFQTRLQELQAEVSKLQPINTEIKLIRQKKRTVTERR